MGKRKTLVRAITTQTDLEAFQNSKTYADFLAFIRACNQSVRGIAISQDYPNKNGPVVSALVAYLEEAWGWVDDIPALQQPMRFGNKAFRTWHARLEATAPRAIENLLVASQVGR
ncbi:phosphotyrosyl phosphatase activator family protein [Nannochloropsis gaditana]|uniref:Serine/threonine-protein phosphatase 2A activator n=1 Tax=Nannochloropsis gaditana TaxID=72520 RepID=W7TJN7_9STRA|nr:phosphotyrosyl phosphatase activator family protein [Nannochloropsis gaditana]